MTKTHMQAPEPPYSLHDMNVIALELSGSDLRLRTQSGVVRISPPYEKQDGYVEFHGVYPERSFVYLLGLDGNPGVFHGEKLLLRDFLARYELFGLCVMDESYCPGLAVYGGYFKSKGVFCECMLSICHNGGVDFITEE